MFNVRIGICFARYTVLPIEFSRLLSEIHCVQAESFDTQEWQLDLEGLKKDVPEICWPSTGDAVDCNAMSIQDFYWATV